MWTLKLRFPLQRPTRANGAVVPAAICGVLAALGGLQLALTHPVGLPQQRQAVTARQPPLPRPAVTPTPPILARTSIFAPGRAASDGSAQAAGHVLAGTLSVRGRAVAIMQAPGGAVRRVPVGGTIDGMTLLALDAGGASFRKDGQRIHIAFGRPTPGAAPPQQPQDMTR